MHFENMKVEVTVPGEGQKMKRKKGVNRLAPRKVNHYYMTKWIENAALDEETKAELLKQVAGYPANTMGHFFDNIHKHIARIHKKRQKKQDG